MARVSRRRLGFSVISPAAIMLTAEVPQCGYCQSGQIMQAAELLAKTKNPTREQLVEHMDGNICRCGAYLKIISAIQRAAWEG